MTPLSLEAGSATGDLGRRDHAGRHVLRSAWQRHPRREEAGSGDEQGGSSQGAGEVVQAGIHPTTGALLQRRARKTALHLLKHFL
jgi:hypothetical protein